MSAVVDVRHLEKRYGSFVAVEDVSFSVEHGEIFGILGPNGAGRHQASGVAAVGNGRSHTVPVARATDL